MAKINLNRAEMEGGRIQMCSQPHIVQGKLTGDMHYPACHSDRLMQFSHTSRMDWEGKVEMPEDQNMDCTDNYGDMDVSSSRMTNDILRLKKKTKCVITTQNGPLENDIDKKLAGRKVVPPVEKDEHIVPQEDALGVINKRLLKRSMTEKSDWKNTTYTQDPVKLKNTADLIQKIKTGKTPLEGVCITYNPEIFSDIANLQPLPDAKKNSGTFGDVLKVKDMQTGQILMKKMVKKNSKGEFELERNEIEIPLQFLDSENIAKLFGLACTDQELVIVMEDAGISLRQMVNTPHSSILKEPGRIEKIMLDSYTGISHLSKHRITHCDIKPENICLNIYTWKAKLVDFGSSKTPQNVMDYKGITPEYLDPSANRFLYEYHVLKNKQYPCHKLDEKDDVYGMGLVGLFLLMEAHPMIQHFTGSSDYPGNPAEAFKRRMLIMKQISEINEGTLQELLGIPMSNIMKELLFGVLALDREKRWTSKMAALFLKEKLIQDLQPPNKLSRQEQLSCQPQVEDLAKFVDLHGKYFDKDVSQRNRKQEQLCDGPVSPNLDQSRVSEQGLGIAFKVPAFSGQPGQILAPAKLQAPLHKGQMGLMGTFSTSVQYLGAPSHQGAGYPLFVKPKLQRILPEILQEEQDAKESVELVQFFENLSPSMSQRNIPTHLAQTQQENHVVHPSPPRIPQRVLLPNVDTGQIQFNPVLVHRRQQMPNEGSGFQGLFGQYFNFAGHSQAGPIVTARGNIPDMDAIMQSSDELARPKVKGVRRNRASQD